MRGVVAFLRWVAPLALVLAVMFAVLRGCRVLAEAQADPASDGLIIQLAPGSAPPSGAVAIYGVPDTYAVPAPSDKSIGVAASEYAKRPDVMRAEPNVVVSLDLPQREDPDGVIASTVNDPYSSLQYSLSKMDVYRASDTSKGDGVVIAILDSGIDFAHPDLQGKYISTGRNFVGSGAATDDHGHGTHVAGIAAAATNNGVGLAGVGYNARILPVKVLSANGSGSYAQIVSGINYALDNNARVINLSLGGTTPTGLLEQAIANAWARGAVLTCAAGNSSSPSPIYPAAYPGCIAVAATDQGDRRAEYSNYGDLWVDVGAPGSGVFGTTRGGGYEAWNGTSMAAPNAAGVVALIWGAHPTWTNVQVRAALEGGADGLPGQQVGRGRVNAYRAVNGSSPAPQPTPVPQPQPTQPPTEGDFAAQVEQLINQARAANGLPPLRIDVRLRAAGDSHNRWMSEHDCFAHQCPGESSVYDRIKRAGYAATSVGENIGKGYLDPAHMMDGWMNSAGHRAAILNTYWPDLGCAFLQGPSGEGWDRFWSCEFASGGGVPLPPATATLRAQPTVIVPPTRSVPPTSTLKPPPTATALPWPGPPTPRPLPTVTSAPGGAYYKVATVYTWASSPARSQASFLCGFGYFGVSCADGGEGVWVIVRVEDKANQRAKDRVDELCKLDVVCK